MSALIQLPTNPNITVNLSLIDNDFRRFSSCGSLISNLGENFSQTSGLKAPDSVSLSGDYFLEYLKFLDFSRYQWDMRVNKQISTNSRNAATVTIKIAGNIFTSGNIMRNPISEKDASGQRNMSMFGRVHKIELANMGMLLDIDGTKFPANATIELDDNRFLNTQVYLKDKPETSGAINHCERVLDL